ncbi:MAG: ABC transporter permease subunit, partial [Lachnospiraceae bacterium]|nr:ABC transporter permease subunit [Candidatus Minthocola equi]
MILALRSNYVDAVALDEPNARFVAAQNPDLKVFKDAVETDSYGFAMTKDGELTDKITELIKKYSKDGTLDELSEKWFSGNSDIMHIDMSEYTGYDAPNGKIRYIHDSTQVPMSYVDDDGSSAGYEVELALMIAKELGMTVEISKANFSALIMAVSTGTADIASGSISITDERRESVDFPETHYVGGIVLLCRADDIGSDDTSGGTVWERLADSFDKTFIKENRWQLFLSGLLVTLIITVASLILGTMLGFVICAIRRSRNAVVSGVMATIIRVIQGIPVVVLLMVFYYIVFASSGLNAVAVAIIGFTVNFGVNSAEIMRSGIDSIDKSQWESASCLGFSKFETFRLIILPQSIMRFLPPFKGEFINMMKMTSVVGYIAVQDVTKAFDLIRSRTYEAVFPLIVNALIYVLLAWGLTYLIGLIEFNVSPQKRERSIKGLHGLTPGDENTYIKELSAPGTELIRLEHLRKEFRKSHPVISDANAVVNSGDIVAVIGPSGCGKSTILRLIMGLEKPTSGNIFIHGMDTNNPKERKLARKNVGMVFQSFDLFPHLTVIENVMLAPTVVSKIPKQDAYENALRILKSVGLAEKMLHYPHELSGGQRQRVAIARTLAMSPEIILFDEPTSALDPKSVSEVLSVINSLADKGFTMMIVTHEMRFAKSVSTRVFYVDQGEIHETGSPDEVFNLPQKEKTRKFIHKLNTLEEKITSRDFDFIGANARIEEFGQKNDIPRSTVKNIEVVFEEMAVLTIMPALPQKMEMDVQIEYFEKKGAVAMRILYNGAKYDPMDKADRLSELLIGKSTKSMRYNFNPDERLRNEVTLSI